MHRVQLRQAKYYLQRTLFNNQLLRSFAAKSSTHRQRFPYMSNEDYEERELKLKEKYGDKERFHLHKSKGQHLLTNLRILDAIVREAGVKSSDTVLEIGPGTGNLTMRLLEVAKKVVAVEIDKRMIEVLNRRVVEGGFEGKIDVICNDALKTEFPKFDVIVANIPYGISSPLIAKFVFGEHSFRNATLLLQKEFARRLLANPGDSEYNRLAVNVKLVADVQFVMNVSKREFVPNPRVDSSVVKIQRKEEVPDVDIHEWWAFTRTCFTKKNKTLGAAFKQKKKLVELLKITQKHNVLDSDDANENDKEEGGDSRIESEMSLFKEKVVGILDAGGFGDKRPSKMSNKELLCLLDLFNQAGIHFHDQDKSNGNLAFDETYYSE